MLFLQLMQWETETWPQWTYLVHLCRQIWGGRFPSMATLKNGKTACATSIQTTAYPTLFVNGSGLGQRKAPMLIN